MLMNPDRKPRLLFCSNRPSRYAEVLTTLRATFEITLTENSRAAGPLIEAGPDAVVVEDQLVGGEGSWIVQQAHAQRSGKSGTVVMVGPKYTGAIGRLLEDGVIDTAIMGPVDASQFLQQFWRAYGTVMEDEAIAAISAPAAEVMRESRQLFIKLETLAELGGIGHEGRKLVANAAASVVDLADEPSVAPMLHQLRGHHDSTFAHSLRVGILMASFARAIGVPRDQARLMAETGLLHDIGKLRIPLSILAKPSALTEEERLVMNRHPVIGADMVCEGYRDLPDLISAVRHHHEKLDGTGYPNGQIRTQIHEMALCTAVVDVFCALTDRRDYKPAMDSDEAFAIMDSMAGHHLETRLYNRFRELVIDTDLTEDPIVAPYPVRTAL